MVLLFGSNNISHFVLLVEDYNKKNRNKINSQVCQKMMDGKNLGNVIRQQRQTIITNNRDDCNHPNPNSNANHKDYYSNNQVTKDTKKERTISGDKNDKSDNNMTWPSMENHHALNGPDRENYERKCIEVS